MNGWTGGDAEVLTASRPAALTEHEVRTLLRGEIERHRRLEAAATQPSAKAVQILAMLTIERIGAQIDRACERKRAPPA